MIEVLCEGVLFREIVYRVLVGPLLLLDLKIDYCVLNVYWTIVSV
jgi:hypothetical protein